MSDAIPARSCGTCSLCCKVYAIPMLEKPRAVWCGHCAPGKGCGIHASRPQFCRDFECLWIRDVTLGPEWKPEVAKFVLNWEQGGQRLSVVLDPGAPNAWKREPYHAALRRLSGELLAKAKYLCVYGPSAKHLILPDSEVYLGKPADERAFSARRRADGGFAIEVDAA